jgi:hypothetical protein
MPRAVVGHLQSEIQINFQKCFKLTHFESWSVSKTVSRIVLEDKRKQLILHLPLVDCFFECLPKFF